jgi:hypothetical protein
MEFTLGDLMGLEPAPQSRPNRRLFIGGSDARIIMSPDEAALIRLCADTDEAGHAFQ